MDRSNNLAAHEIGSHKPDAQARGRNREDSPPSSLACASGLCAVHTTQDAPGACLTERSAESAPSGFARLARRISGWTSNLLATAVVVVASLAVGRQIVQWWRVAPADSPAFGSASIALPEFGPAQTLALSGGAFSLRREEFSGDRAAAAAALRDRCRGAVPVAPGPAAPPDRHEQSLLDRLADAPPVAADDDWQYFELSDALPIAVVVRDGAMQSDHIAAGATGGMPSALRGHADPKRTAWHPNDTAAQRRVVIWAMAFPSAETRWTLYLFHAAGSAAESSQSPPSFALPPGSRRTLAIGDGSGGALTAFAGKGDPQAWMRFFRDWFASNDWTPTEEWREVGSFWHARFHRASRPSDPAVSIHLGPAGDELVGIICSGPTQHSTNHEEGKR